MKGKKKGIKIGAKVRSFLSPAEGAILPNKAVGANPSSFNSFCVSKLASLNKDDTVQGAKGELNTETDSITPKEPKREGSKESKSKEKLQKKGRKSINKFMIGSPPISIFNRGGNNQNLVTNFSSSTISKLAGSNQNIKNILSSFKDEACKSMKEDEFQLMELNKQSLAQTEEGSQPISKNS